ncbi:hypothetical protein [Streptomyces sp. PR69]|uniref:hypothetical protein n=1 Tax=Streptomyces sp. PR69 TaxID=2984950 RepID=UPI002264C870|nr:hypothetical protein [Streptomyces sp. PR69]
MALLLLFAVLAAAFAFDMRRRARRRAVTAERLHTLGFLPAEQQSENFAGRPAPELLTALAATRSGDWRPAAALLAGTAKEQDWERRTHYATSLGSASVLDDRWLTAWESERPDDPDAAVVRANRTVSLAWHLRGGHFAQHTSAEQFAGFHSTLALARGHIARAAELNPADPTPYIAEINTARGLGYSHANARAIWSEIMSRAPLHFAGHHAALQYWCAKWHGSNELARDFAARAAASAPPGSLLTAFPLIAWYEQHSHGSDSAPFRGEEAKALVDAALADAAAAPADHPQLARLRHLLAYFLVKQRRYDEALEQFRHVDGFVGALPWIYSADSAARQYAATRDEAVAKAQSCP